eukprot:gene18954-22649_t
MHYVTGNTVIQPVSFLTRDLLTYGVGIGCTEPRFVYELDPDFCAFPTYPVVLGYKGETQDVVGHPSDTMLNGPAMPNFEGTRVGLDAERYVEKINPLNPKGGTLLKVSKLISVKNKGAGALVEEEAILCDASGKAFYRIVTGTFLLGARGVRDEGTSFSKTFKVPARSPDKIIELATSRNQALIYRLSGDYNPLHVDPTFALASGFEEPILHGLCSLGFTARAVLCAYCDNDASKFKSIRARFSKPVIAGQTLVVEMWKEDNKVLLLTK